MNKKTVLALAVGAAFAAPVYSQTTGSTIEIYGRLYPAFASFKASDATEAGGIPSNLVGFTAGTTRGDFKRRNSIDVYNSRVGLRGRETLGGGLSAIWQMEQRVQFDRGDADFWANRDSFVGLAGGFGSVRFGRFDTIHNDYGNTTNFWGIKSGHFLSSTSLVTDSGLGPNNLGFDVRRSNSLKYETPEIGGFQAGLSYSPDESKGNPGREGLNSDLWAAAVKWSSGPVYLSAQYEVHNDAFDGSTGIQNPLVANGTYSGTGAFTPFAGASSKDRSMRVSARYSITPDHRISGDLGRLEYEEDGPGLFRDYKRTVFQLGWEASWGGPWRSVITYARANDGKCSFSAGDCDTEGLKASQLSAGVAYDLSKRTFIYTGFARQNMGESAQYDNWTNGTPPRGSSVTQWGVGVTHSF